MAEHEPASRPPADVAPGGAPGIRWEPGEEDYPFAAQPGESALAYLQRWLSDAGYARMERDGARYIHETDMVNVFNHITADVDLLRARLEGWGDRIMTGAAHAAAVERIENAVGELQQALATLRDGDRPEG